MSAHNRNRKIAKWAARGLFPLGNLYDFKMYGFTECNEAWMKVTPKQLNPLGVLVTSKHGKRNYRKVIRGERSLLSGSSTKPNSRGTGGRVRATSAGTIAAIGKPPTPSRVPVDGSTLPST